MNNNWLNDLDKKVQGAREQAPEHVWDNIADQLFAADYVKIVPLHPKLPKKAVCKNNRVIKKIIRIGSAIAVALLLVVFFYPVFYSTKSIVSEPGLTQGRGAKSAISVDEVKEKHPPLSSKPTSYAIAEEPVKNDEKLGGKDVERFEAKSIVMDKIPLFSKSILFDDRIATKESRVEPLKTAMTNRLFVPRHIGELNDPHNFSRQDSNKLVALNFHEERIDSKTGLLRSDRWSIGAYSNRMVTGYRQRVSDYAKINGELINLHEYAYDENYNELIDDIVYANADREVVTTIQHRLPVAVGLAVQYCMNKNISLNVGLNYAQVSSTLSSGSSTNKFTQSQKLNYIGIPVQMNYKIWNKEGISAYLAAGTIVEKPIYGQVTDRYVLDDNVKAVNQNRLKHSPLQLSVNTGVGGEAQLTKNINIYIEPTIRYNMDTKSKIQTIYNHKPVNFNLNLGFRVPLL